MNLVTDTGDPRPPIRCDAPATLIVVVRMARRPFASFARKMLQIFFNCDEHHSLGRSFRSTLGAVALEVRGMRKLEDSVARELLARSGIGVIWQAHVAAQAAYRSGNNRAANILLNIADSAETIWRGEGAASARPRRTPGMEGDKPR